ncbi:hypothetical protein OEZ86_009433 [Tetradesmus obliquus]|nr:hypothetical protein OEZ86_009433 [Tetradesmus obliquus]
MPLFSFAKSLVLALTFLMAPTKNELIAENDKLKAEMEELKKKASDAEKSEADKKDPMEVDEADLAASAGAAAAAAPAAAEAMPPAPTGAPKGAPAGSPKGRRRVADADVALLGAIIEDPFIRRMRDVAATTLGTFTADLSPEQRAELGPSIEQFTAACVQVQAYVELSKRGYAIQQKTSHELGLISRGKGANDSPSKIRGCSELLVKPQLNEDAVRSGLTAAFEQVAGKITPDTTPESLMVDLETLLQQHQSRKRTRATKALGCPAFKAALANGSSSKGKGSWGKQQQKKQK